MVCDSLIYLILCVMMYLCLNVLVCVLWVCKCIIEVCKCLIEVCRHIIEVFAHLFEKYISVVCLDVHLPWCGVLHCGVYVLYWGCVLLRVCKLIIVVWVNEVWRYFSKHHIKVCKHFIELCICLNVVLSCM